MYRSIFSSILSFVVIGFLIWIFLASDASARMGRACSPITALGNMTESLFLMTAPEGVDETGTVFSRIEYGCRFTLWRLIYEEDYLKQEAQSKNNNDAVTPEENSIETNTVVITKTNSEQENAFVVTGSE